MVMVLFVCVGNSARSQMAESLFNAQAPVGWNAVSAGTKPASAVSSDAIRVMAESGVDISGARPKPLTEKMIEEADRIVTMGCGVEDSCPPYLSRGKRW